MLKAERQQQTLKPGNGCVKSKTEALMSWDGWLMVASEGLVASHWEVLGSYLS